jgi:hypothetical protein
VFSVRRIVLPLVAVVAACNSDGGRAATDQPKPTETARKLAGVYPEDFKCETIISLEELGQLLGGTPRRVEGALMPPRGVAAPCNYEVSGQGVEYWTYDMDCRDGMKKRADALFAQYATDSAALVQKYNELADAGIKPTDAGIAIRPPESSAEVAVGAKALDHHGRGLIFIDDDAPCYVRVIGPDFERRVALAKAIAKNLTFSNAPMTPRPMP